MVIDDSAVVDVDETGLSVICQGESLRTAATECIDLLTAVGNDSETAESIERQPKATSALDTVRQNVVGTVDDSDSTGQSIDGQNVASFAQLADCTGLRDTVGNVGNTGAHLPQTGHPVVGFTGVANVISLRNATRNFDETDVFGL